VDDSFRVYVVECADGTLYTGIARDVQRRVEAHNLGRGARYTRGRGPVRLLGQSAPMPKPDALRLELRIKRLRGPAKLRSLARAPVATPACAAP
jgi:putative endonuclease